MPGLKGKKNVGRNIAEFHGGKTYQKTKRKFGKKKADEQAVAVGMQQAGVGKKRKKKSSKKKATNRSETEM